MADKVDFTPEKQKPEEKINNDKRESKSFVVDLGSETHRRKPHIHSLQAAFLKFRRDRQNEIRQIRLMKHRQLDEARDPVKMDILRTKFAEQAKNYFGVPYAKKYWKPEDTQYHSSNFLDCCGLIRQVVRDLSEDFGFQIGMWNQAYMFDTLPIVLTEEEMKPGDLVFISATYYNTKSKKQRHDMVHVEIWLGDGPQTIGARWQKGKVQVFPHYAFEAKSYHSESYHFRSIDTWLMGICQSFCPEHPWRLSAYDPSRMSIFSPDGDSNGESAGDTDNELVEDDHKDNSSSKQTVSKVKCAENLKHQNLASDCDNNFYRDVMKSMDPQHNENSFGGSGGTPVVLTCTNQTAQCLPANKTQTNLHSSEDSSFPCSKDCHCTMSALSDDKKSSIDINVPEKEIDPLCSCEKAGDESLTKHLEETVDSCNISNDSTVTKNEKILPENERHSWLEDISQKFPLQLEEGDTCNLFDETGDN